MNNKLINKLKLAFIGGGLNSAVGRAHVISSQLDGAFQLVSGCFSRDNHINNATAEKYGIDKERIYHSPEELLKNEKDIVDAVVILTPQDKHFEHLVLSIKNSIPVICEKALVSSLDEALYIKELIDKNDAFLRVTYNYTGYPMVREIKEIIANGQLGKLLQIQIEMPQEGFIKKDSSGRPVIPQDWRLHDEFIPTVSLDLGIHIHHLIEFLTREKPESIIAHANSYGNFKNIVDNINILAKYTNDLTVNMWYSKAALGNRNGLKIRIYGSDAAVEWVQESPEIVKLYKNNGERSIIDRGNLNIFVAHEDRYTRFKVGHPAGYIEAFANYYTDIKDDLIYYKENNKLKKNKYTFGVDEAIDGLRFLTCVSRSIKDKKWISYCG